MTATACATADGSVWNDMSSKLTNDLLQILGREQQKRMKLKPIPAALRTSYI